MKPVISIASRICLARGGGGVHNMLKVWVCAAHMGGFLGPKFSKQGYLFGRFSLNRGGFFRNWPKESQKGVVFR